ISAQDCCRRSSPTHEGHTPMLNPGPAKKVTLYLGEDARLRGEPLYLAVLNYLFKHEVSGTTVTKGVAGFGAGHHLHTSRLLELAGNLPIKIEFIESAATLDGLLPGLLELTGDHLVEIQDTTIVRAPK